MRTTHKGQEVNGVSTPPQDQSHESQGINPAHLQLSALATSPPRVHFTASARHTPTSDTSLIRPPAATPEQIPAPPITSLATGGSLPPMGPVERTGSPTLVSPLPLEPTLLSPCAPRGTFPFPDHSVHLSYRRAPPPFHTPNMSTLSIQSLPTTFISSHSRGRQTDEYPGRSTADDSEWILVEQEMQMQIRLLEIQRQVDEEITKKIEAAQELARLLGADGSVSNASIAASVLLHVSGRSTYTQTYYRSSSSVSVTSISSASATSYMTSDKATTSSMPSFPHHLGPPFMSATATAQISHLDLNDVDLGLGLDFSQPSGVRY